MKLNKHTIQQMNNACMCNVHENVCTNNHFWIESFTIANIHHICIKWIVKMQFLLDLSFISSYYFVHSFLLLSLPLYHNKFTYICTMCNAHSVLAFAIFLNCKRCSCRPAFNFEQICIPLFWFKWKQTEPNQMKRFSFFQIFVLYSNILRRNSILIAITNQKWEETEGDNKKKTTMVCHRSRFVPLMNWHELDKIKWMRLWYLFFFCFRWFLYQSFGKIVPI